MANTAQARKRAKQNEKKRAINASQGSTLKTLLRKVREAVKKKDSELAASAWSKALPYLHRMSQKGLIHRNKASRYQSRLSQLVKNCNT